VESIVARLRRLGKSADFFGGFKAKDLAGVLEVSEADVRRWQRNGWLRRRRGRITEASFSSFCKEHPEEIPFGELAPETQYWLVSVHGYQRARLRRWWPALTVNDELVSMLQPNLKGGNLNMVQAGVEVRRDGGWCGDGSSRQPSPAANLCAQQEGNLPLHCGTLPQHPRPCLVEWGSV
jgi:hypothetical protein